MKLPGASTSKQDLTLPHETRFQVSAIVNEHGGARFVKPAKLNGAHGSGVSKSRQQHDISGCTAGWISGKRGRTTKFLTFARVR